MHAQQFVSGRLDGHSYWRQGNSGSGGGNYAAINDGKFIGANCPLERSIDIALNPVQRRWPRTTLSPSCHDSVVTTLADHAVITARLFTPIVGVNIVDGVAVSTAHGQT